MKHKIWKVDYHLNIKITRWMSKLSKGIFDGELNSKSNTNEVLNEESKLITAT